MPPPPHRAGLGRCTALACALLLGVLVGGGAALPAEAAPAGWARFALSGTANSFSGTMRQRPTGFPVAEVTSDSAGGAATGVQSGASTFLSGATDVGARYGSSKGQPYLNLRPYTANGSGQPGSSTTTYRFERPTPGTGWTFVLGDVDADRVTVAATGADGAAVDVDDLGFRAVFNYCGTGTCAADDDVPSWDAGRGVLTGNDPGLDTNGASAWFEPRVPLTSLTLVFTRRTGFPVYQTWFAALSHTLSGRVSAPGDGERGLTVRLLDPDGVQVATTRTDASGRYRFGDLATYDGYRVALDRPEGLTSDDPLTRRVDLGDADPTADFALRRIVPVPVGGTVRDPDGKALAGVVVTLAGPGPDRTATTDGDGAYLFDDVPTGAGWTLTAAAPEGTSVSGPRTFTVPPDSEQPVTDQDFVVTPDPRGAATGRVTSTDGDALAAVLVTVTGPDGVDREVRTDADGRWEVAGLPPGRWTATVTAPGGASVEGDPTLGFTVTEDGSTTRGLDVVVDLPAPVEVGAGGTVTDDDGVGVKGLEVEVDDPTGAPYATATTDDDGTWDVDGLPVDTGWSAVVEPPEDGTVVGDARRTFDTTDGDVTGLDFVLSFPAAGGSSGGSGSGGSGSGTTLAATGGPDLALLLTGLAATASGAALVGRRRRSRG